MAKRANGCENHILCPNCPSKYAMFEGPLLCIRVIPRHTWSSNWTQPLPPPYWEVINGAWNLVPPYKYTGGVLPKMLWSGPKLPAPERGYNTNIHLIEEMIAPTP